MPRSGPSHRRGGAGCGHPGARAGHDRARCGHALCGRDRQARRVAIARRRRHGRPDVDPGATADGSRAAVGRPRALRRGLDAQEATAQAWHGRRCSASPRPRRSGATSPSRRASMRQVRRSGRESASATSSRRPLAALAAEGLPGHEFRFLGHGIGLAPLEPPELSRRRRGDHRGGRGPLLSKRRTTISARWGSLSGTRC